MPTPRNKRMQRLRRERDELRSAAEWLLELVEHAIEADPSHPDELMRIVAPDDYLNEVLDFCSNVRPRAEKLRSIIDAIPENG